MGCQIHQCEGVQLFRAGREEPEGAVLVLQGKDVLVNGAKDSALSRWG